MVDPRINLQLTGKISLKLNSNSSLLLDYGHSLPGHSQFLSLSSGGAEEEHVIDYAWANATLLTLCLS